MQAISVSPLHSLPISAAAAGPHPPCVCLPQVSLAALSLLQVCINRCSHVLESSLDKLMPLLFLKLCGAKQSVRSAAEGALQGERLGPWGSCRRLDGWDWHVRPHAEM